MTTYSFANMPKWARKVQQISDAIVRQSVANMISDIEVVPGINRGGSRVRGTIPRDLGALASSFQTTLHGGAFAEGEEADTHVLVIGGMAAGDKITFSWGGNVAPYAEHVHYGTDSVEGTYWIDEAISKWPDYVTASVFRAKALLS